MTVETAVTIVAACAAIAGGASVTAIAAARSVFRQIAHERAARSTEGPAAPKSRARVERHHVSDRLQR